ncbi:hypothetical protein Tco_1310907 [Tanacetum coccineum]
MHEMKDILRDNLLKYEEFKKIVEEINALFLDYYKKDEKEYVVDGGNDDGNDDSNDDGNDDGNEQDDGKKMIKLTNSYYGVVAPTTVDAPTKSVGPPPNALIYAPTADVQGTDTSKVKSFHSIKLRLVRKSEGVYKAKKMIL